MSDAASDAEAIPPDVRRTVQEAEEEFGAKMDLFKAHLSEILRRLPPDDEAIDRLMEVAFRNARRAIHDLREVYQWKWEQTPEHRRRYLLARQRRQDKARERASIDALD